MDPKKVKKIAAKIVKLAKDGIDYGPYVMDQMADDSTDLCTISKALAVAGRKLYPESIK